MTAEIKPLSNVEEAVSVSQFAAPINLFIRYALNHHLNIPLSTAKMYIIATNHTKLLNLLL